MVLGAVGGGDARGGGGGESECCSEADQKTLDTHTEAMKCFLLQVRAAGALALHEYIITQYRTKQNKRTNKPSSKIVPPHYSSHTHLARDTAATSARCAAAAVILRA